MVNYAGVERSFYLESVMSNNVKKVWARSVKKKLAGLQAYSIGEYVGGKWRNFDQITEASWGGCRDAILDWSARVCRPVELVPYRGERLPDWLRF